jgi:hypothetical protein
MAMKGVSYITNEKNKRTAVIIDLNKYGRLWEDFYDYLLANNRKNEPKSSLDSIVKRHKNK